jgi:CheY-like chemotaxis protein
VNAEAEAKQRPEQDALPRPRPLTVLVVDDRRDAAYALMKFMEHEGHAVHAAKDGPGAVDLALEIRPEVIICDIGLPGFDGYEVARRIRATDGFSGCLLIAVTGYGQPQDKSSAESAGFDCHFVKPVNRQQLIRTIAQWSARGDSGC